MAGRFESQHLDLESTVDVLDHVQRVSEEIGRSVGLDEETLHWTSMAVRETVINAIMHGNKNNPSKRIFIDFECVSNGRGRDLVVRVRDQGDGFNPEELADPLAPENILNLGGRGLFLVRQFMDAVDIHPALQGGTEVRMLKHI